MWTGFGRARAEAFLGRCDCVPGRGNGAQVTGEVIAVVRDPSAGGSSVLRIVRFLKQSVEPVVDVLSYVVVRDRGCRDTKRPRNPGCSASQVIRCLGTPGRRLCGVRVGRIV